MDSSGPIRLQTASPESSPRRTVLRDFMPRNQLQGNGLMCKLRWIHDQGIGTGDLSLILETGNPKETTEGIPPELRHEHRTFIHIQLFEALRVPQSRK
jgi:hypothetical protein